MATAIQPWLLQLTHAQHESGLPPPRSTHPIYPVRLKPQKASHGSAHHAHVHLALEAARRRPAAGEDGGAVAVLVGVDQGDGLVKGVHLAGFGGGSTQQSEELSGG